jgi:hypothetical protein
VPSSATGSDGVEPPGVPAAAGPGQTVVASVSSPAASVSAGNTQRR